MYNKMSELSKNYLKTSGVDNKMDNYNNLNKSPISKNNNMENNDL